MMRKRRQINLVLIFVALFTFHARAQNSSRLDVGDPPPEVRFSKWIKGEQFTNFDPNHIYVMEFWATWCGPCKAAMPHMTELQRQYQGKVTFVGVNVWEKTAKDQGYETVIPAVEKFVAGNATNMGYTVIVDNNEQYMGTNWLRAAGQNGIPASFIIKGGRIMWIGHPGGLDDIIPKVLDGSFDVDSYKEEANLKAQKEREFMEARMAEINPIQDALVAKEYQKAFDLMDKLTAKKPDYKKMMDFTRFKILLTEIDENRAVQFAKDSLASDPSAKSFILSEVYKVDGLSPQTYLWAATTYGNTAELSNPVVFDALATCYAKGGDLTKAIENQTKAVETGQKALKDGTMVGTIMDYTVEEYKTKLKQYQEKK